METSEKFAMLDALVADAGLTNEELVQWFRESSCRVIFPMVQKVGNDFHHLKTTDVDWQSKIWGYEIFPGVVLAKKCGPDDNVKSTTSENCRDFAEKLFFNGERGSLPPLEVIKNNWTYGLKNMISAMDTFLCDNGADAEEEYYGDIICSGIHDGKIDRFDLVDGSDYQKSNCNADSYDRLAVYFPTTK